MITRNNLPKMRTLLTGILCLLGIMPGCDLLESSRDQVFTSEDQYTRRLIENVGEEHVARARQVAMEDYVPVGNGGALSEFHGKISKERKLMYRLIEANFERYLHLSGMELKRLQDGAEL